jgi:hypothetical protein
MRAYRGKQNVPKHRTAYLPGPVPAIAPNARPCDDDLDLFFEGDGERGKARDQREKKAKAICATCPIQTHQACLETALKAEGNARTGRYGIFAGLNGEERAQLARQRQEAAA